jgi:hypothetical protein
MRPSSESVANGLERTLLLLTGILLAAWAFVVVVNVDDLGLLGWDDGARMGLARSAGDGVLYPPLFDGTHYGGTRFMPIPIALHAGMSRLTGELVSSGKLVTLLAYVLLGGGVFLAARTLGSPWTRTAILVGVVSATQVGAIAGLSISPDALPIALQLLALVLVARREPGPRTGVAAGLICATAFLAKFSALWGPAAIAVWLWRRSRRTLMPFLLAWVAGSVALLGLVQVASDGRFAENLLRLSSSGLGEAAPSIVRSSLGELVWAAPALLVLFPLASIETVAALRRREWGPFHLAFLWAVPLSIALQLDVGSSSNHFLDLLCLTAVLVAGLWVRWNGAVERRIVVATVVGLAFVSSLPTGFGLPLRAAVAQAATGTTSVAQQLRPLDGIVAPTDTLLSESALVPIVLGQDPVVLDPFMLAQIDEGDPGLVDPLIERIERCEFDHVVLVGRLDDPPVPEWYRVIHLGPRISGAIARAYVPVAERGGYVVYEPRPSDGLDIGQR